jgi:hypothetical protein
MGAKSPNVKRFQRFKEGACENGLVVLNAEERNKRLARKKEKYTCEKSCHATHLI